MITGPQFVDTLRDQGVTHVVWLPDSVLGRWDEALEASDAITLVRVCREGEAWLIAAGLHLGGASPVVVIQNTGLFESGDALRNVLFDLCLPIYAVVGYRSYLSPDANDSARRFTEPILEAWNVDYIVLEGEGFSTELGEHLRDCRQAKLPGIALMAEGSG